MTLPLTLGSKGPYVGNWQRFLNRQGALGQFALSAPLIVDENFGPMSASTTKAWQKSCGTLADTGVVDSMSAALAVTRGFVPFIQAKNCNVLWPSKRTEIDLIVIHTMEAPEKPTTAFNVATWFAGASAPVASANYCIGAESLTANDVFQCVRDTDIAWGAPGANSNGIHLEHVGYASQTPANWGDSFSQQLLETSAQLAAQLAQLWSIPVIRLTPDELKKGGVRGFCGHVDVTNSLNNGIGHQDPGPNFPWTSYLTRVKEILSHG